MYRTNVHRAVKLSKRALDYRAERLKDVDFDNEFWWLKYKMPWGKYKGRTFSAICKTNYQYIENLYIHLFRKPIYMAVAAAVKYHYQEVKKQIARENEEERLARQAQWEQERIDNVRPANEGYPQ